MKPFVARRRGVSQRDWETTVVPPELYQVLAFVAVGTEIEAVCIATNGDMTTIPVGDLIAYQSSIDFDLNFGEWLS